MPELVLTEARGAVGLCTLNRPEARNALSPGLREALATALEAYDADEGINCIVIAGDDEAFAAGADVRALAEHDVSEELAPTEPFWRRVASIRTPMVAAVSGWALGGGCELALTCDMIVASETAEFGQPEITLAIIPGGGGTQRLARLIGKPRAMELILTGRRFDANEALQMGMVNRVTKKKEWLAEALELAEVVARRPPLATRLAKEAILTAEETGLTAGVEAERRLFGVAMATEDRVEAMQAFLEKRKPDFHGR
ncbi:MAG: enoyl-CoA hydratase [Actinobacteria bacterium]|nr:enoyl-CoA hydratase [Actinomycetota bacterium]